MISASFIAISTFTPPISLRSPTFNPGLAVSHAARRQSHVPSIRHGRHITATPSCSPNPFDFLFSGSIFSSKRGGKNTSPISEIRSTAEATPSTPPLNATVVSVTSVTANGEYIELVIDTSESGVHEQHTAPGQSIRLGRVNRITPMSISAIISSSPQSGPLLHLLIAVKADPCKLAQCRPGESVAIGEVCGVGIDYNSAAQALKNLFIFADSPQAFATVRSLIEWPAFRAMSGTGANRTTSVTVFYSMPAGGCLPYGHCLSNWSVFGVNIVPIPGKSIMEFLSAESSLTGYFKSVGSDYAISAVRFEETFESLFCALVLLGFRRSAISKFSEADVAKHDLERYETRRKRKSEQDARTDRREEQGYGMPDAVYAEQRRQQVEREIWAQWVRIREEMRYEFEDKWAARTRADAQKARSEAAKQRAWETWSAQNGEQWTNPKWDDTAWSDYWQSWYTDDDEEEGSGGHRRTGAKGGSSSAGASRGWNQQDSQEYWDWVGRGTDTGSAGRGSDAHKSSWWANGAEYGQSSRSGGGGGGSTGWGNANNQAWSGYQRGYRYEYDEQRDAKKKESGRGKGPQGQSQSSQGGRNSWKGAWNGNGKYGRNGRQQNTSGRASSSSSAESTVDLYGVLGITSGANRTEIKKAYRRQAMEHHPDHNPDRLEEAHVKIKQIVVAWTVLKDDSSRKKYDMYGVSGL